MEKNKLKNLMKVALSGQQITNTVNANLMTYREIKNKTSIDDVLGKNKACVILYETEDYKGHWCCIFEVKPELIEFFDPYGYFIDSQLNHIPESYKQKKGLTHTFLMKLLYYSNYKNIEYNNYPLQQLEKDINTCGRHVIVRLLNRNMKLDDYFNKIRDSGYSPDVYVTLQTKNLK